MNKQIAIAEQEVKLNRSELLPRIGVRGSYDYLHGLEVNDETLMKKGAFSVFLNVVHQGFAAAVQVVEFGFGDGVVHVDGGNQKPAGNSAKDGYRLQTYHW